jgi:TolB protein
MVGAALALAMLASGCATRQLGDVRLSCRCERPRALTAGVGDDTEAAWSPDGRRIAFQRERAGDLDILAVDVASGATEGVVVGEGQSCYPTWTPGGALVYALGHHPLTSSQAAAAGANCGYNLRMLDRGSSRALSTGYWRDYTPAVSADGAAVYFASTRECEGNCASLWRLPLTNIASAAACVLRFDGASAGAVSPSLSPDGTRLLWAQLDGFRSNWRIWAARADEPQAAVALTPETMSAYAPRWSPDGKLVAFTGFCAGESGWGVYVMEPRSGSMVRLKLLAGNSKSPAWSPDGRELAFENNCGGVYKLYRVRLTCRVEGMPLPAEPSAETGQVESELWRADGGTALAGPGGALTAGRAEGDGALAFERPPGLDFGGGAFFVRATFMLDGPASDTRIVAVGHYAEHALGWQLFVRESGKVCFSTRDPKGGFVGVSSDRPVVAKKAVTVLGVRDADGGVRLYVDGVLQAQRASGATLAYGPALRVCLGQQWNGGMRLPGRVLAFACGRGYPAGVPRRMTREALFVEAAP